MRIPALLCLALAATPVAAQAPPDTVRSILALDHDIRAAGPAINRNLWPGFQPDTIPTLYIIPRVAKVMTQWRGAPPESFHPVPGATGASWIDTSRVSFPAGRLIAFLGVDSGQGRAPTMGLALHERFHSHERAARVEGRRFGWGENSMLTATYPVYHADNEAAFALESRLLHRAWQARDTSGTRRLVRAFLAVRRARQARLDSAMVAYEQAAELHEGMAQYLQLAGIRELAGRAPGITPAQFRHEVAIEGGVLDSALTYAARSVRRRFYATGAVMGLLLDRLSPGWKEELLDQDRTVQEELASVVGPGQADLTGFEDERLSLEQEARQAVEHLGSERRRMADSITSAPGLVITLDPGGLPSGHFDWCGFDPQNLLQDPSGRLLHLRFLRICGGEGVSATISVPAVQDTTGLVRLVLPAEDLPRLLAGGSPATIPAGATMTLQGFELESDGLEAVAPRAVVTAGPDSYRIRLMTGGN